MTKPRTAEGTCARRRSRGTPQPLTHKRFVLKNTPNLSLFALSAPAVLPALPRARPSHQRLPRGGEGGEALPGATLPGAERPRPPPGPGAARGEPGGPDAGRGRGGGQAGSGRRVCVSPGSPRPGRGGGRREKQRAAPGGAVLLTHSPEPQVGREGRRHRPAQPRPPPQATKAGDGEGGGGGTRARGAAVGG